MSFRIFTIAFDHAKEVFIEEELNMFCLNKKISAHKAEFFMSNGKAYWTVFIEYDPVLSPAGIEAVALNGIK